MSMLEEPDAPHRFGQSTYKGEMVSVVKPPDDKKAAKTFKPMAESDRKLIAQFLANEAAEVKDAQHDAAGAKLISQRCTGCHMFRGQTDDDESIGPELSGWGSLAWTRAADRNPRVQHDVPQSRP